MNSHRRSAGFAARIVGFVVILAWTILAAAQPATINIVSGGTQNATVNTTFGAPMAVQVLDAGSLPVVGATVTFTVPASGASASFPTGTQTSNTFTFTTDATGVAGGFGVAGTVSGAYSVSASVGALAPVNFSLTNNPGAVANIAAVGGSPQSAPVTTAFLSLQAGVVDAFNNGVPGVTVTFTAPGTGASGTFPGPLASTTAVTNAAGVATAPTFGANQTAGSYAVAATAPGAAGAAIFALTNTPGPAANIAATTGSGQLAPVSTNFATALQATVTDAFNNPVPNQAVIFAAPGSGASGLFGMAVSASVNTDASGIATAPTFTANAINGPYTVQAGFGGPVANFTMTNVGPPATIVVLGGTPQSAMVTTAFASILAVQVNDSVGTPVAGAAVTFTAPGVGAGGIFVANSAATITGAADANGQIGVFLQANTIAGSYSVSATSGAATAGTFNMTNLSGPAATIATSTGSGQSATVNTAFGTALSALVTDVFGNPVAGNNVTFISPGSGASGNFPGPATAAIVPTNGSGIAVAPTLTANTIAGNYQVGAAATGVASPTFFTVANSPGAPATITPVAGSGQSAAVNGAFATALQANVQDAFGNNAPGASVTFTAPASGASGAFSASSTVTTDASGNATAPTFTANGTAGAYTVTATVTGVVTPANFSLTNNAGAPASITATSGGGQSVTVGTAFLPLTATVKDSLGNLAPGVTVTFSAPLAAGSGASGTFASGGTAVTNASGVATSPILTANGVPGTFTATAKVTGVTTPASFSLTNKVGAPASLSVAGNGQVGIAGDRRVASAVVTDSFGNPVPGVGVSFAVTQGSATLSASGATSDASGGASVMVTFGTTAGPVVITVSAGSLSATISMTISAPASITALSNTKATIPSGSFGDLVVKVTDAANNPLAGVHVSFTSPTVSNILDGITGQSGIASSAVKVAVPPGTSITVTASVAGLAQTVTFTFTAGAGSPALLSFVNAAGQSALAGGTVQAAVLVTDATGFAVSGVAVTFAVQGGGGTLSSPTATTDSNGMASTTWTLGATAGPNLLQATATGVANPAVLQVTGVSSPGLQGNLVVTPGTINLQAVQGGSSPDPAQVTVSNGGSGVLQWTLQPGFPSWITPSATSGSTPTPVTLAFSTGALQAGDNSTTLTFTSGTMTKTVNIKLTIGASSPASFKVTPAIVNFVTPSADTVRMLKVDNPGSGTLSWTATTTSSFLTVNPTSGSTPTPVTVTLNPAGLTAGTTGTIQFSATGSGGATFSATVNVMVQFTGRNNLVLSPRTLTFNGPTGGTLDPQSFKVDSAPTSSETFTAGGGATPSFVTLSPTTGGLPGNVSTTVSTSGLTAGVTTGSVPVTLSGGSTDSVAITVDLGAATDKPKLVVTHGGYFTGTGTILTLTLGVKSNNGAPFSWNVLASTTSGGPWLSVSPASGTGAGSVKATVNATGIAPGVYRGELDVTSSDTVPGSQVIPVTLRVNSAGPAQAASSQGAATGLLVATNPPGQFLATATIPVVLSAVLVDANGNPVTGGSVQVQVSGQSTPILLKDTGQGNYEGSWTPLTSGDATLTFSSTAAGNADYRVGTVVTGQSLPVIFQGGAVNAASFRSDTPLVPGSIAALFGQGIAGSTPAGAAALPLPLTLAGASLRVNNVPAPLFYGSAGQINFQVPWELTGQTSAQFQVSTGGQVALLDGVTVAPVGPGIFTTNGTQGAVIHQNGSLADASAPATAGEVISIFATGLGDVANRPASGAGAGAGTTTKLTPAVTIGGSAADISFSGLAPGSVGLYQVNVKVPAGVTGNSVALTLTIGGLPSNTVTIAVK